MSTPIFKYAIYSRVPPAKVEDAEAGSANEPQPGPSASVADAVILMEEAEVPLPLPKERRKDRDKNGSTVAVHGKTSDKNSDMILDKASDKTIDKIPDKPADKPGKSRTKSNQRWMKLRTTVQLSSAISSSTQKSKTPLKREDSFLKRFSTRQVPETQETVDNGDDIEVADGSQTQHEVNRRRRKKREELSRTVVNPDENFYLIWLLVVATCVLYNLWALIVRQSFPEFQELGGIVWYLIDALTDIVYVLDIMVQFRTGYLEQGLMVYNSKKLAVHYIKSRAFTLDTLSMAPLDLLQVYFGVNPILRFPRFLKVYRVYNYYYMVESRTVYPNLWRVVNLIHILLILAHWFGCFYYLISEAEGFRGGWVYPFREGEYATLTRKYLGSLYWSTLTLTTIGDLPTPETDAEYLNSTILNGTRCLNVTSFLNGSKVTCPFDFDSPIRRRGHKSRLLQFKTSRGYIFTIISYLIGVFIFATIVGQVGNVITNRNANRLEFERLLDGAKTYMRHHKVPGGMKRRVLRWYDYSWSRGRIQGGGDINTALGLLPDKLKTELALHVNLSVLKKVTIFQECQPEFLHDLVLKMKAYIFTPGDLICRKGEVAREMFIIADGILDVISENGRVLTTMNAGDFFGEIGILNLDGLNKRTADVRSVGYSELFSLSREDVLAAMKDYPEAQEILQTLGRKRLMEAKNAARMHKPPGPKPPKPDHDSSGETDVAGKKIVEKLRSDVKGLKSVLRRSRRGTRTKESMDAESTEGERTTGKKHSTLRRMSHVQSSEEHEEIVEVHSPVGAGLPLLQRLKLLKEKEKQKSKRRSPRGSNVELELVGSGVSLVGKPKTAKQEERPAPVAGPSGLPSTVRTQVTGVRFDKGASKSITITSPQGVVGESTKTEEPAAAKQKDSGEPVKVLMTEKFVLSQPKETLSPTKSDQEPEKITDASKEGGIQPQPSTSTASQPTETEKGVPKLLGEVSKRSKEAWKLLKISSISSTKFGKKSKTDVSKKAEYLSKSDTVLEKQITIEKEEDKRSRSISPSLEFKESGDLTSEGGSSVEAKRSRALGHIPRQDDDGSDSSKLSKDSMKKYDSISDLSPEYSGLPFVKKLKILNERQRLAALQQELETKSASLDGQEPSTSGYQRPLVRSQSEAGTMETRRDDDMVPFGGFSFQQDDGSFISKTMTLDDFRKAGPSSRSQGELASPESNETLERRHLKSILKKLSAEDSTSDEDQGAKKSTGKEDTAELKKLMRAPTVEGYAARHKKLIKSVTFDSETMPSPLEQDLDFGSDSDDSEGALMSAEVEAEKDESVVEKDLTKGGEGEGEIETPLDSDKVKLEVVEAETSDMDESAAMPYVTEGVEGQEEEVLGEVLSGIQETVQGLLVDMQSQYYSRMEDLEDKLRQRDELILELQSQIVEMEVRKRVEFLTRQRTTAGERGETYEPVMSAASILDDRRRPSAYHEETTEEEEEEEEAAASSAGEEASAIPFDEKGNIIVKRPTEIARADVSDFEEYMSQPSTSRGIIAPHVPQQGDETTSDEEIEAFRRAAEERVAPAVMTFRERNYIREYRSKRNYSVDDARMYEELRPQKTASGDWEFPSHFTLPKRRELVKKGPVQVETESGSDTSDSETAHNEDWEIQMLVEELEKKEMRKKAQSKRELEVEEEDLEDMKRLQEELDTLKKMVCESDLSRLSASEYDMLEKILEEKDRTLSQIAKSRSLDEDDRGTRMRKSLQGWDTKSGKRDEKKKSSLRRRLGQALSFDFHDIDRKKLKSPDPSKGKRLSLRKQKTIPGIHSDKGTFYGLFHASKKLGKKEEKESLTPTDTTSRVSLPVMSTCEIEHEKASDTRKSLPTLSSEHPSTYPECLVASVSSADDVVPADLKESCESVFEESQEIMGESHDLEMQVSSPRPSTSGGTSIHGFFKSVGQKVKRAMSTEGSTVKPPVPTISIICEDKPAFKKGKKTPSVELAGVTRVHKPEDDSKGTDKEEPDQEPKPGPSQA